MTRILPSLALAAYAALILLVSALNLTLGPRIGTDRIPMNWGLGGNPSVFAPKQIGLWFPVLLYGIAAPSIVLTMRQSASRGAIGAPLLLIGTSGLLLAVHAWHLSAVLAWATAQP